VRDGVMAIGDEKINFYDWLMELKHQKWKKAWDEFWIREEGIQDVLL